MYARWSVAQLESVMVPVSLSTRKVESALVRVFDRFCDDPLLPWAQADTDPVRREIDDAVAEAYGISGTALADWRERLAREPTVANRSAIS